MIFDYITSDEMINMDMEKNNEEYEEVISNYYKGRGVSLIISLKVDTKLIDKVAEKLAEYDNIEDLFLVTGDVDLILKARFRDYDHMKDFLIRKASNFPGIEDVKSMMIVTTYKERGVVIDYDSSKA